METYKLVTYSFECRSTFNPSYRIDYHFAFPSSENLMINIDSLINRIIEMGSHVLRVKMPYIEEWVGVSTISDLQQLPIRIFVLNDTFQNP